MSHLQASSGTETYSQRHNTIITDYAGIIFEAVTSVDALS